MSDENKIDDGGPAFPVADLVHPHMGVQAGTFGMSLRDWFAGMVLAKIVHSGVNKTANGDAVDAYMYADAMLKARSERIIK